VQITPYHQKMHLNDGDLEPDTKKCPLCGFEVANKGLVVQIKPLILLRKCSACFGASVSRMPKELTLTKYYTTSFSDTWYDSINSERIAKTIHKRVRNFTKLNLVDQISILDYGGGDGSLSLNLANRLINSGTKHVNLTIIDYTRAIPDHRNSAISVTYLQTLPQVLNANFEFIILSAVLEHLVEPVSVLKDLVAHLSSDGIVWIRTPQMFGFF